MKIELYPIDAVTPHPDNPFVDAAAIPAVAWSIREIGFINPILLDADGVVIAGHTRLAAARSLGMTEVPVIVCADLTPDRVHALRVADSLVATLFPQQEEARVIDSCQPSSAEVQEPLPRQRDAYSSVVSGMLRRMLFATTV